MFGGQQPILVLSEYENSLWLNPKSANFFARRPKHEARIGPQSAVGEYSSRKGMSVCE